MLQSGFHGNRGGVGKPEMLQTPLLLIAAQCTVLQKILLFGGGGGVGGEKSPNVFTFQLAEFLK